MSYNVDQTKTILRFLKVGYRITLRPSVNLKDEYYIYSDIPDVAGSLAVYNLKADGSVALTVYPTGHIQTIPYSAITDLPVETVQPSANPEQEAQDEARREAQVETAHDSEPTTPQEPPQDTDPPQTPSQPSQPSS